LLAKLDFDRALVALVPGVAFHVQEFFSQARARLCGCPPVPRSTPLRGK
jgi:hypothetical protein